MSEIVEFANESGDIMKSIHQMVSALLEADTNQDTDLCLMAMRETLENHLGLS